MMSRSGRTDMLNYKGLRGVRERLLASEDTVDAQIDRLLEQNAKIIPVTGRPSQLDDELVLDYAGECGGSYFPGGTAEKQTLVLGSGAFIPGFEEQLVGRNVGDSVDVRVTFPTPYHAPELAGKKAVFHCKIHEIRVRRKYAPNDEFAREVGGCESYAAFRDSLRKALQDYMDRQADDELKQRLIDQICAGAEFEISEKQLEAALDHEMRLFEAQLGRQGLNLDQYCSFMDRTKEQLREEHLPDARRNIERQIAIDEIARLEGIEADEASVLEALDEICRENGVTIDDLRPHMDEAFQAAVERSVVNRKVLDRVLVLSEIEEVVRES